MPEPGARYEWLTVHDDGSLSADLRDTSPAETDRRMVITQELLAGRVVLAADYRGAVDALKTIAAMGDWPDAHVSAEDTAQAATQVARVALERLGGQ